MKGITDAMMSMKKHIFETSGTVSFQKCKIIVINNTDVLYEAVEIKLFPNDGYDRKNCPYYTKGRCNKHIYETGECDKHSQIEYEIFREIRVMNSWGKMWIAIIADPTGWREKSYLVADITPNLPSVDRCDTLVLVINIEKDTKIKFAYYTEEMDILS
uniref:Uncharacterized protein n=1 Tax=Pithovirus LCPAC401 TaxID=2506595 RepID=A0A481ZAC7_9VIRU|nr:MAG: hypothetical protein LCPAC401_04920 [Pithovirus LCPAC401]